MEVSGELLTPEQREQVKAPCCKNNGKIWDLHEMSLYVDGGYQAIAKDDETSGMLKKDLESLHSEALRG